MRLVDQIAQCRTPFIVQNHATGTLTRLSSAADFSGTVNLCRTRYVLSDDLTRLCTALAYSRGARTLACADLLRVPAELVWVEWCEAAWQSELQGYGFRPDQSHAVESGRRGALIRCARDGRRGSLRTFWSSGATEFDVLASSMEAYFDLDTEGDGEPAVPDGQGQSVIGVFDAAAGDADVLRRCFRFRYERSWAEYYDGAALTFAEKQGLARHALGSIAIDVPVLMAFFLLLATRTGLPQRPQSLDRLNRLRARTSKPRLLDHIEVNSPMIRGDAPAPGDGLMPGRRRPRLHHVRGHLVRRGNQLFWRLPHLRGNVRSGAIRTRTVTWTFDHDQRGTPAPDPQRG